MSVQSLNTICKSNLDLDHTLAIKIGGSHLGNNMADIKFFFQKFSP